MEYIYTAMLLHKSGQKITEEAIKRVLEAAGVKVDSARVKALIASLEGINIDEVIEKAAVTQVVAPVAQAPATEELKKEDKAKKPEETKKSEEQAAAGLGALFG